MKKHIALGATLLLTLGTAVAGTMIYGQDGPARGEQSHLMQSAQAQVTPEMIALWKATSRTAEDIGMRVPL
jgi:hypothetical protein